MKDHKGKLLILAAFLLLLLFFSSEDEPRPRIPKVKLVLYLVVDQLPQEYLRRFRPFLKGGIATLLERGAVFSNAHYKHANTATCPGHATLVSGVYPSKSGVIGNAWYDRQTGQEVYCIDDPEFKKSPRLMLVQSFGDWLKNRFRGGKVFAASGKDRSAVMLGGKNADAAFWYDKGDGAFITSAYYKRPDSKWQNSYDRGWLREFNEQRKLDDLFGTLWNALPLDPAEMEKAQIVEFDRGVFQKRFPYSLGISTTIPESEFYRSVYGSPYMDLYVADFATTIIDREKLGQRETTDMLALSFSALDTVGHSFGPNSREVLDTLIRLDMTLGELFKHLDKKIGLDHVMIVFSSDHGVQPFPELWPLLGREIGHRQGALDVACVQRVWQSLREKFGTSELLRGSVMFNFEAMKERGISVDEVETHMIRALESCPMIEKMWSARTLSNNGYDEGTPYLEQFQNSFHPDRSSDLIPQLKQLHVHRMGDGTGHGSPHEYDTHVPLIFMHPNIKSQKIDREVALVDTAVTLAGLLGLEPPKDVDGVDRSALVLH